MISIALKAIEEASKISLAKFKESKKLSYKQDEELVTDIDIDCERKIKQVILEEFPNHKILGEEQGLDSKIGDYLWLIDPIDGTVNYSRGIQLYGISVALAKGKKVILGVVCNPITSEVFRAEKGKGAYLNDKLIQVSRERSLLKSVIYATELYKTKDMVFKLFDKVKQFRITSSSAYETCLVAAGRTEAFIKVTNHPWGFAAANLVVEEAGGKVTNLDGTEWSIDSNKLLSSNGLIHNEILKNLSI